jgi:ABC-2 type transport system ATP-binding protein
MDSGALLRGWMPPGPQGGARLARVSEDGHRPTPALAIRGLTKCYDDGTLALDALDLAIPDGAFFGLLGPNGAGKTTLINSITGLVRVTEGAIRVFGHEAVGDSLSTLAARRLVGLSPQDVNLDRFLTVYESLLYHGGYYGLSRDEAARRSEGMIDVFDLRAKRQTRTPRLSGGLKRRLLLARALLHQPRLVILDEPTAGVDYELRLELWRYIRLLHARGTTILLTTHYLEEAEALCEQIALIRDGRIVALDSPSGLRRRYEAESLGEVYVKAVGSVPEHVETQA